MSLVYEALQKAEREKERKTGAPPARDTKPVTPVQPVAAQPLAPPPAAQLPPSSRSYLSMLIACVAVAALAGIVYMVLSASKNIVLSPTAAVSPAAVETRPAPATPTAALPGQTVPPSPAPSTPATSTENDPRFRLTGIMKMGDSFGAVINGRVVYQDNYVDGGVVKKVERDRVTLDVNGRETVLRLF